MKKASNLILLAAVVCWGCVYIAPNEPLMYTATIGTGVLFVASVGARLVEIRRENSSVRAATGDDKPAKPNDRGRGSTRV